MKRDTPARRAAKPQEFYYVRERKIIQAAEKWFRARMARMGDKGFEGFLLQANRVSTADELAEAVAHWLDAK